MCCKALRLYTYPKAVYTGSMTAHQAILIIEDDQYTRDIYREVLEGEGYRITTADDGVEGVVKASQGTYDLILLDMMMPKLNGISTLKELKQKHPAHAPVVLLTNLAQDPVVEEALALGAKGYLIKADMNPDQLVAHIKKLLL